MDFTVRARHDELNNVISLLKLMSEHTDGCGQACVTVEYSGMPSADTACDTEAVVPKEDVKDEVVAAEPVEKEQGMPEKPRDEQETKHAVGPDIEYTKEDVISALQNLAAKKGKRESKGLLKKYGCQRVSELKPEDYAGVITDIERMI